MEQNPFAPAFEDLPDILPIFPLSGVLLLPFGQLPLNIFEPRYLAMVDTALTGSRMIGMVQPSLKKIPGADKDASGQDAVFNIGCAGKITDFMETPDGRYLITLTGICRFNIVREESLHQGFRRVRPDWRTFEPDLYAQSCLDLNRGALKTLLQQYFDGEGMSCDWKAIDTAPDGQLITSLSMICPFEAGEKQALLEAECCRSRARLFMTMLEMAVCRSEHSNSHH